MGKKKSKRRSQANQRERAAFELFCNEIKDIKTWWPRKDMPAAEKWEKYRTCMLFEPWFLAQAGELPDHDKAANSPEEKLRLLEEIVAKFHTKRLWE